MKDSYGKCYFCEKKLHYDNDVISFCDADCLEQHEENCGYAKQKSGWEITPAKKNREGEKLWKELVGKRKKK